MARGSWYGVAPDGTLRQFPTRTALRAAVKSGAVRSGEYQQRVARFEYEHPGASRTQARGHAPLAAGGAVPVQSRRGLTSKEQVLRALRAVPSDDVLLRFHVLLQHRQYVAGKGWEETRTPKPSWYSTVEDRGAALEGLQEAASLHEWVAEYIDAPAEEMEHGEWGFTILAVVVRPVE